MRVVYVTVHYDHSGRRAAAAHLSSLSYRRIFSDFHLHKSRGVVSAASIFGDYISLRIVQQARRLLLIYDSGLITEMNRSLCLVFVGRKNNKYRRGSLCAFANVLLSVAHVVDDEECERNGGKKKRFHSTCAIDGKNLIFSRFPRPVIRYPTE